jgi:uncharacterized protein
MSRPLRDALKRKYRTPQEALAALGLDETLIEQEQSMNKVLLSRRGAVAKGALMALLRPVLAADASLNLNGALKDLTVANFADRKKDIARAVHNVASKKLAKDAKLALDEVEKAMDVAEKDDEPEAKDEEEMKMKGKDAKGEEMPKAGKSAIDMKTGCDAEGFKKMLKEKMSEDDYKAACDMMEEGEAEDEESEEVKMAREEKEKAREMKEAKDKKAKDAKMSKDKKAKDAESEERVEEEEGKEKITKGAMDAALAAHGKTVRATERGIRVALDQVRPIIGELSSDLAFDSATDVFRHAATVLDIKGAKTMHADALWPVIEAQAQLRQKQVPRRESVDSSLGFDSASISEAVKIAPGLERIGFI